MLAAGRLRLAASLPLAWPAAAELAPDGGGGGGAWPAGSAPAADVADDEVVAVAGVVVVAVVVAGWPAEPLASPVVAA